MMPSYSFSTLFVKSNSSPVMFESIKVLEIKTSILFNLDFANNTILSCSFSFFLLIETFFYLYFFILAVVAKVFNLISELVISIGIPNKQAKAEIEIHPVIAGAKSVQYNLELYKAFCTSYSSVHFVLFLQGKDLN